MYGFDLLGNAVVAGAAVLIDPWWVDDYIDRPQTWRITW